MESYPETEQSIVPVVPLSSSPSVFEEVRLANSLLVFRSGQNYIIDTSTSLILVNFKRPIEMSNLFVRNNLVTNYAGPHILPSIEANSDNLSQPKLFSSCWLNFIFIWTTLLVTCLANICSRMRRILCDYFDCRNIKSSSQLLQIADSRASEKEDKIRCKAESGDIDPASLDCLNPKPVSDYQLQDEQCTFIPDIDGHIVGASPANPIIIDDHYTESSGEGRIQVSCEQSSQSCNVHHQTAQSAIQGRLEVGVTLADDQLAQTGLDGNRVLKS